MLDLDVLWTLTYSKLAPEKNNSIETAVAGRREISQVFF